MSTARQARGNNKHAYPTPSQIVRLIRALRGEGINPSSLKVGADGSIHFSAIPDAGEVPSDFDIWAAAGKL